MLSVQNPASFANQPSMTAIPLPSLVSSGQSTMQMAAASGGLGQMAEQASATGSVPQFSLTPQVASPILPALSTGTLSTGATPTPFTQALGSTPLNQPLPASVPVVLSGQSPVAASSFNQPSLVGAGLPTMVTGSSIPTLNVGTPGSALAERMMGLTPEQQEIEMIADRYLAEQGTEEQLLNFFAKYKNHRRASTKCALDGRYFYKVLAPYKGLVPGEMYIRINVGGQSRTQPQGIVGTVADALVELGVDLAELVTQVGVDVTQVADEAAQLFWMGQPVFDLAELAATKSEDKFPRYRLIKLIIDISDDPASNLGSVHSNLLYIDTWKNKIYRFEPMTPSEFTEPINVMLETYFGQEHLLPDYEYEMLPEHPQLPVTDTCPSKGMCAAYVLKKAMMLVTDNDRPLNLDPAKEEKKILFFADAIETEYGILPEEVGERDQTGFSITLGTPGPYVTPYYYGDDWLYTPEYYGYYPHHRFARPWGWGWTHGGGHFRGGFHHGRHERGMEGGTWEDVGRKLDLGWMRAKEKMREYKERVKNAFRSDAEELESRRKAHHQRLAMAEAQHQSSMSGSPRSMEYQRELSASRLDERPEMGRGEFYDPQYLQQMARMQREQYHGTEKPKTSVASGSAFVGNKFAAGITKSKKSYGFELGGPEYNWSGEETGCGCDGCHMAQPANEYGYWSRDETGKRKWNPVSYGGAIAGQGMATGGASYAQGYGTTGYANTIKDIRARGGNYAVQTQGEMFYRPEEGCGCGVKPSVQMGAEHGRWSRAEYNQWHQKMMQQRGVEQGNGSTLAGGIIGGTAGLLVGGPVGAVAGAGIGAGTGYAASRGPHTTVGSTLAGGGIGGGLGYLAGGPVGALAGGALGGGVGYLSGRETGDILHPSTWQRSTQDAVLGGVLGGGAGYLLGGGKGALLGAGLGGLGGYALGGGFNRGRETGSTLKGGLIGAGTGFLVGGPIGAIAGGAIGAGTGYAVGKEPHTRSRSTLAGAGIGAGTGAVIAGPPGAVVGGLIGAGSGYLGSRQETGSESTVAGALIGGGAGYLLGGGLTGVILGGAAGAGAGYLLGRRGYGHRYYPYHQRYWH